MNKYQNLINKLLECAMSCEHCSAECLKEDDVKMMTGCISLDRDCADICLQAASLLQRDSQIALQYLLLCEEVCRACAAECEKHEQEHCKHCARVCNECADLCHQYHQPIQQS